LTKTLGAVTVLDPGAVMLLMGIPVPAVPVITPVPPDKSYVIRTLPEVPTLTGPLNELTAGGATTVYLRGVAIESETLLVFPALSVAEMVTV
jgi:hypothetical protein